MSVCPFSGGLLSHTVLIVHEAAVIPSSPSRRYLRTTTTMSYPPTRTTVSRTFPPAPVLSSPFEPIFDAALQEYKTRYQKRRPSSTLISKLQTCISADAVVTELRNFKQSHGLDQPRTSFALFLDSTSPVVLYLICASIGIIVDLVSPGKCEMILHDLHSDIHFVVFHSWGDYFR